MSGTGFRRDSDYAKIEEIFFDALDGIDAMEDFKGLCLDDERMALFKALHDHLVNVRETSRAICRLYNKGEENYASA